MASKKNVLLTPGSEVPLLRVYPKGNSETGVDHFLKKQDLDSFSVICNYLAKENHFNVFLGGGAPESFLFTGKQNYNDLDLIATFCERQKDLEAQRVTSTLSDAVQFPAITIQGKGFQVNNLRGDEIYMNILGPPTARFILHPLPDSKSLGYSHIPEQPSPIDLIIYKENVFNQALQEIFSS